MENLKWGVRQRLEFLERELYWSGQISRKTLMDKTGVSISQASMDIAKYREIARENLVYSHSEKTYFVSKDFKPVFISTSPHSFLSSHLGHFAEQITFPLRDINSDHLRTLHRAIEQQGRISIEYQSLSSPASSRIIAPHHYVFDGYRWHVRAYDFKRSEFRDFVLGRIVSATDTFSELTENDSACSSDQDDAWNEHLEIVLVPHPGLSPWQKRVVETDFGMENGQATLSVRRACLIYLVSYLRLVDESENPVIQQVVLFNKDVLESDGLVWGGA